MKRLGAVLFVVLASASALTPQQASQQAHKAPVVRSAADEVTLKVAGDVKVVEVEQVVIVKVPREVVASFPFTVEGDPDLGLYFWTIPGATFVDMGNVAEVTSAPQGDLTVSAKIIDKVDGKWVTRFARRVVSVGTPGPKPPEPKPEPPVPPKPPEPKPDGTSPFADPGLRVMISFRTNVLRTEGERAVIYGKAVRDYLDAKCVLGPASEKDERGQTMRDWRIWPSNTDSTRARKVLHDAWIKRGEGDWILIGDGKTGTSQPMPKTEADALALLKKWGG